ncbi:MAG: hypothetical protein A4E48_00788 [Methanosaeta sp. PtaU1.Bin060]|nr:MAG: hypothetical protein A4E48_00788 [Methanosaeta sp. PtaU1.Bin060]
MNISGLRQRIEVLEHESTRRIESIADLARWVADGCPEPAEPKLRRIQ